MKQYDAIIIGTGQAGPPMAKDLVSVGRKVAIAEGYRFGGSCVNYGCRPTKVLRASARVAHLVRRAADFGVAVPDISIDWPTVKSRVETIIDDTSEGVEDWLRGMDGLDVYPVYAHFVGKEGDNHLVDMAGETVAAPQVFLNTGTRARIPDVAGIESVRWLNSERALRLDAAPAHLMILGGSYIGLELGQAFRRLGSKVTIIETNECLINREDPDIKREIHRVLSQEGITIHTRSTVTKAEQTASGSIRLTVDIEDGDGETGIEGSHWLNAIGRIPNTDSLNLAAVGVEVDSRGFVVVDDGLQTTAPNVYALGDINAKGAFTHTSYHDYEIVRDNLLHGKQRSWRDRIMAYNLYVDPPLGRVGMSEQQARDSGKNVLRASMPMSRIGRAIEQDETAGMMKLLVDADTEQFLGAAVLGFNADEVIQSISYFMATGASYKVMQNALPIHPTIAEFLPTVLGRLKPLD